MEEYSDEELKKLGFSKENKEPKASLDDVKATINKDIFKNKYQRVEDAMRDNPDLLEIMADVAREEKKEHYQEQKPKEAAPEKNEMPQIMVEDMNVGDIEKEDSVQTKPNKNDKETKKEYKRDDDDLSL